MISNSSEHLQQLSKVNLSEGGHFTSNPKYDFIKIEEETILKNEIYSCQQSEGRQNIKQDICKYDAVFHELKESTSKYTQETFKVFPFVDQLQSAHFADLPQMLNICGEQSPLKYCEVGQVDEQNIFPHDPSYIAEKVSLKAEPCKYLCLENGDSLKNFNNTEYIKLSKDNLIDSGLLNTSEKYNFFQREVITFKKEFDSCSELDAMQSTGQDLYKYDESSNLLESTGKVQFKPERCEYIPSENGDLEKSIRTWTDNHISTGAIPKYITVQNQNLKKPFQCKICVYSTNREAHLRRHIQIHTGVKPFKCKLCGARLSSKSNLLTHTRTHTGDKPFKCEICDYSATNSSSLVRHIRVHTRERPFKCENCDYRGADRSSLGQHIKTHTEDKPFQCKVCNYSTVRNSHLRQHIRTHTGKKPFKCDFCDYCASSKSDLLKHTRTHTGEKPFKCDICDYRASDRSSLMWHKRNHTGEKPFKCEICHYSSVRKAHLVQHMRIHTGEKPFKCEVCDYSASDKSSLVRHVGTHSAEKPFQCKICLYSTARKSHLWEHVRSHMGEKPFKCGYCDYSTYHKGSMVHHIRAHMTK